MLTSLFGELRNLGVPQRQAPRENRPFEATAILESVSAEVNESGQIVDSSVHDLVVTGSPAQAIRNHFAATRADLDSATKLITLVDPTGVWASAVVKALSDASGRPIERLHLRENGTLRTLAMIERTTLVRRREEPLRIYHADVRAPGSANAAIPMALMERAHMTAVIVGAMSPHAIDDLLETLRHATHLEQWRCPTLLFMLPPNAVWISNKIATIAWPQRLRVQVLNEALVSASAVWNALLGTWKRVRAEPAWEPVAPNNLLGLEGSIKVADFAPSTSVALDVLGPPTQPAPFDAARSERAGLAAAAAALDRLVQLEGVLACAVVDASSGVVLAERTVDFAASGFTAIERAAAASSQILRVHRQAARAVGMTDPVDEVVTTAGLRYHLLRSVPRHRGLLMFMLMDKTRSTLALARFKLMDASVRL